MHRFEATTAYQYATKYGSYSPLTNCFDFLTWAKVSSLQYFKDNDPDMLHVGRMLDQTSSGKGK